MSAPQSLTSLMATGSLMVIGRLMQQLNDKSKMPLTSHRENFLARYQPRM